jgi:MFS family permease
MPPHVLTIRPFLWVVVASAVASVAFWAYFGTLFADAAFRFRATPTETALLLASFSLPFVVITPLTGIAVDRWSPKWLMILGYLVLACAIPVAYLATSIGWLAGSILLVGIGAAATEPARSSLTGLLVPEPLLVQANGMYSSATHGALLVGTIGSGILLGVGDADLVYAVAGAIALLSLPVMLLIPDVRQRGDRPAMAFGDLVDGVRVSWHDAELRLLLVMALGGYVLMNLLFSLEPILIRDVIGGGPQAVQFLWAANGAGAVVGALWVSRISHGVGVELTLTGAGFVVAGLGLMVYAGIATFPVAMVASGVVGVGFSMFFVSALALVQRAAGEERRGRVTAVFGVLQEGTGLLSSLALAAVGAFIAVQPALVACGFLLALGGLGGLRVLRRLQREGRAATPVAGGPTLAGGRRRS